MDIVSLLQVVEKLLTHFSPERFVDVVENVFPLAIGNDDISVTEQGKMVAHGRLIDLQALGDLGHGARPIFSQKQHNSQLAFLAQQF